MAPTCEEVFIIYGITDCPACLRVQADLMQHDIEYAFVETDFSKKYRELLKKKFNWPTFPIIVKLSGDEEVLIGGYNDLLKFLSQQSKYDNYSTPILEKKTELKIQLE